MGLFSFFRKSDNYEEILAALDADIKKAEKRRVKTQQQAQRWLTIWTMYTLLLWVVYSVGFWLYGWPMRHNMSGLTLTASITSVLGGPFFIYYSRKIIRAWFRQSLERQGKKIEQLMSEQKEKIRELKEKTKYDKTKNLIDRYESPKDKKQQQGPILLGNPAATIVAPGDKKVPAGAMNNKTLGRIRLGAAGGTLQEGRRRSVPSASTITSGFNTVSAAMTRGSGASPQLLKTPVPLDRKLPTGTAPGSGASNGTVAELASGAGTQSHYTPGSEASTNTVGRQSNPWYDKLVNKLVGEDEPAAKYALICRNCYAHNGLVLPEELQTIRHRCPKCGHFNPSRNDVALAAKIGQWLPPTIPADQPIPQFLLSDGSSDVDSGRAGGRESDSRQTTPIPAGPSGEFLMGSSVTPTPSRPSGMAGMDSHFDSLISTPQSASSATPYTTRPLRRRQTSSRHQQPRKHNIQDILASPPPSFDLSSPSQAKIAAMGRHANFGSPLATRQYRPQDGTDSSSSSEESDDGNSNDGGFGNRSRTYRRAQQAEPVVSREKRIKRSSEIDLSQSKIQEPLGLSPEFTSDEEAEQLASDDHELQQEQPASEDDPVVMEGEELSHPTGQTDNNEDEKSHKSYTGSDDDNATVDNSIRHPQTKHHDNSTEDLHADDSDVNKSHDERPSMSEASEAKKTRATGKPANKSRSGGTKKSPRKKGGRKR